MTTTLDTTSGEYDYTYLSLGAGVQSSALLVLSCIDDSVPKPNIAIFADTGDEPSWVYKYLDILSEWALPYGVEVVITQKAVLSESCMDGFVPIPVFTMNPNGSRGMLRRQCTREYKVAPITKKIRELLGYSKGKQVKKRVISLVSSLKTERRFGI